MEERIEAVETRLTAIERNLDLCLNYARENAKIHLSAEAIKRIEAELADGE